MAASSGKRARVLAGTLTFVLAFAVTCVMSSVYGFLLGAWPFGMVEAIWALVALRRWWLRRKQP